MIMSGELDSIWLVHHYFFMQNYQVMNILLASVTSLPELINGKVCVINDDGTYNLYNPAKTTIINDHYDPMDYSILVHKKYSKCIVYSNRSEKEHYLVNKQYRELINGKKKPVLYRTGDKIHIHSRRGVYELVSINNDNTISITCGKWRYDSNPIHRIPASDFSALAGGLHNTVFS